MNQVWMFGSRIDERLHRKRDMKGTVVPGSPGSLEASPTPLIFDSYMGQSASMKDWILWISLLRSTYHRLTRGRVLRLTIDVLQGRER
jgi:hypothetical protein